MNPWTWRTCKQGTQNSKGLFSRIRLRTGNVPEASKEQLVPRQPHRGRAGGVHKEAALIQVSVLITP